MNIRDVLAGNGRPPTSKVLMIRGVIFTICVGLLLAGLVAVSKGALANRISTTAVFRNAGGSLISGADVKYQGVNVGKLYSLSEGAGGAAEGGIELGLHIDDRYASDIPSNVTARVMPQSIFGTSFVDLVRPAAPTGALKDGARIVQDTSKQTLELQTILDGLDRVVRALGPAELSEMLGSLAGALDGKGNALGQTLTSLDDYLGKLNPKLPLVTQNLDLLAGNLEALQKAAPDLFEATDNLLVTARTLAQNQDNFHNLVSTATPVMAKTDALLSANEKALSNTLAHTAIVVDALYDERSDLVRGVVAIGSLARKLGSLVKDNAMVRVDATAVAPTPADYGRGQCPSYNGVRGRGC
ncbi:MCE family protein [Nocardioides jejuensis]|uniref:MCE family protein n=1 Tax=Nocardioides jejuensis TaxID=2502782 RepID=A0A4R1CIJ0_9ACTN|nr:MCE family protein [Nocardioides jejuensis]TCJ30831.1 MCE family protein [Nocardioides jejuensis]